MKNAYILVKLANKMQHSVSLVDLEITEKKLLIVLVKLDFSKRIKYVNHVLIYVKNVLIAKITVLFVKLVIKEA